MLCHCRQNLRNMTANRKELTYMPNDRVPFSLRIPKELLLRLKELARFNKRSANREAEQILEQYITQWESEHPQS